MAKKIRVIVDYGGPLIYDFEDSILPLRAIDLAEQFAMEYTPKYTVKVIENGEEE